MAENDNILTRLQDLLVYLIPQLNRISESAAACIDEVRSIARSLRPYQLDRFGLTETLEDIGELLSESAGLEVTAEIASIDGLMSPEAEISIYRMTQEWLNKTPGRP